MGVLLTTARSLIGSLIRDDRGQATTEYLLLLSLTAVGAGSLARAIVKSLDQGILRMGSELEKDLRTGRMRLDTWSN